MAASSGLHGFARPRSRCWALATALTLACCAAAAQGQPSGSGTSPAGATPDGRRVPPANRKSAAAAVTPAAVAQLVRATLERVNRANRSGDYRLVHEQLTPAMQKLVTVGEIATALAPFRDNAIDLSPVARIEPEFVGALAVDADGLLSAMGVFQTRPRLVRFKLAYRQVGGAWRLEDFALDTPTEQEWAAARSGAGRAPVGDPPATTRW